MEKKIRKITLAKGYYNEDKIMNWVVGNTAYNDFKIVDIEEKEDGVIFIHIKNSKQEIAVWKKINKSVAFTLEYALDYGKEVDY